MRDLSAESLFEAALRMQLLDRSVEISFGSDGSVRIKLPNTRDLAGFLHIPHYLILRHFALLEKEGLVARAERIGITTRGEGSRLAVRLLSEKFRREADTLLGTEILDELIRRTG